jgi:hypothetical protein
VVLVGGTAVWQLEGDRPGSTFPSWSDGIWWALSTLTTVGYGDYVPESTPGRVVAGLIMIMGVAVLGAVAAVVALIFASAVARREEPSWRPKAGLWRSGSKRAWMRLTHVWQASRNTYGGVPSMTTLEVDEARLQGARSRFAPW